MDQTTEQRGNAPQNLKAFTIIVNARKKEWDQEYITFDQVINLAFGHPPEGGNIVYTVLFKHADQHPSEGSMVEGSRVKVKNETIFNATRTDKS